MCQYNCMSRWQTHVSLSIQHILCNIQYTIYIYTYIYIYICIHQYLLQFTSICPWACEYMCPSVFHNFVRKKKWVHRFARYKKSRPLDMSRCTWLDLTCFYPWARNGKNHPQMVVGPMALGESISGHWKLRYTARGRHRNLWSLGQVDPWQPKRWAKWWLNWWFNGGLMVV